jgi:hypothetical protein
MRGSGGYSPDILKSLWRWKVSFTICYFYLQNAQDGKVGGQYQVSWREAGGQVENWTVNTLQALSDSSPNVHLNNLVHAEWSKHIRKWLLFAVLLTKGSRRTWNKTNNIRVLRLEDLLWCGGSPVQISTRRAAIIKARIQRHTNTKVRHITQTKQKQIR